MSGGRSARDCRSQGGGVQAARKPGSDQSAWQRGRWSQPRLLVVAVVPILLCCTASRGDGPMRGGGTVKPGSRGAPHGCGYGSRRSRDAAHRTGRASHRITAGGLCRCLSAFCTPLATPCQGARSWARASTMPSLQALSCRSVQSRDVPEADQA